MQAAAVVAPVQPEEQWAALAAELEWLEVEALPAWAEAPQVEDRDLREIPAIDEPAALEVPREFVVCAWPDAPMLGSFTCVV